MITSVFKKSNPINYSILIIGVVLVFFITASNHMAVEATTADILLKTSVLGALFASLFLVNFVVKKNGMSKDSAYSVLFFFTSILFFPAVLANSQLLFSNLCILLAIRRIISLQSLKASNIKIFDASIWVFIASLFYFWSILFIVLIFIAILFHVARDYRNWFLPFIAFFAVAIIFVFGALLFQVDWINFLANQMFFDTKMKYFEAKIQDVTILVYAALCLLFVFSLLFTLSNRPLILHPTYKKILSALLIGIAIYMISPNKTNDLLVFTFAPFAMIATTHIETAQAQWKKETLLAAILAFGCYAFFSQL